MKLSLCDPPPHCKVVGGVGVRGGLFSDPPDVRKHGDFIKTSAEKKA